MYSLKESMKWDEDTFNLECDLGKCIKSHDYNYVCFYA